ncbi:hypothetical protein LZ32DRAFT_648244 [Colletotrichum eremochloae]|nr:hypothetical protein LZ32DRAFT_648244 [Colletotrichum eremochloae]
MMSRTLFRHSIYPIKPSTSAGGIKSACRAPVSATDLRDIDSYVARIIADPRTLNYSFCIHQALVSDRHLPPNQEAERAEASDKRRDKANVHNLSVLQYRKLWGLRDDNTPEYARYGGPQIGKGLYPDLTENSFEKFFKETLEETVMLVDVEMQEAIAAAGEKRLRKAP